MSIREFYSAAELAAMRLPGVAHNKRSINAYAERHQWHLRGDGKMRRRVGVGGGFEYHVSLLPSEAREALFERGKWPAVTAVVLGFECLTNLEKKAALCELAALLPAGITLRGLPS